MEPSTAGVFYSDRTVPDGGAYASGPMLNIQDGKPPPACMTPVSIGIGIMFAVVLLAMIL